MARRRATRLARKRRRATQAQAEPAALVVTLVMVDGRKESLRIYECGYFDDSRLDRTRIASVTIPEGVWRIVSLAFHDWGRLSSIVIPASITSIGERAFLCCTSLASVVIGNGVTSI